MPFMAYTLVEADSTQHTEIELDRLAETNETAAAVEAITLVVTAVPHVAG